MGRSAATLAGADGSAPAGQASGTKVRTGRSVSAKAAASTEMSAPIGIGVIRVWRGGRASRGGFHHLANRRDAGDGFRRKRPEGIRHGADEAAVHVDRAAAHAGDDAGLGQRAAAELRSQYCHRIVIF